MALEILKKLKFIECWSTTEARIDPWGERVFHHPAGGGWKNPGQNGGPKISGGYRLVGCGGLDAKLKQFIQVQESCRC